jgi:hypothetical protein
VYHYTTMNALLGIIDSRQLWATNVRYLNDASEHEFFLDFARRRLPQLFPNLGQIDLLCPEEDGREIFAFSPRFLQLPFVASFARESDSRTHWRAYSPGQNGVCIGFRTDSLNCAEVQPTARFGAVVPAPRLSSVFYLSPDDQSTIDYILRDIHAAASASLEKLNRPMEELPETFGRMLVSAAALFKHKSHAEEQEYRLLVDSIFWRQDLLGFRTTESTLTPYVPLTIPSYPLTLRRPEQAKEPWNAVTSITLGPTANMSLSLEAVTAFCSLRMMSPIVKASRLPYRDW